MFNKVSYRRGVIEGVILYTLGRLGALITPAFFPDWVLCNSSFAFSGSTIPDCSLLGNATYYVYEARAAEQAILVARPANGGYLFLYRPVISLAIGLALFTFEGVQQGPAIWRFFTSGPNHLSLLQFGIYELRSAVLLLSFFTLTVICTRLAQGGFLRFTMPAGGNRVTL